MGFDFVARVYAQVLFLHAFLHWLSRLGIEKTLMGLRRTRKLSSMLFMSLSIASIPYGVGSALINAVYGVKSRNDQW
jgi:hypothetical protein